VIVDRATSDSVHSRVTVLGTVRLNAAQFGCWASRQVGGFSVDADRLVIGVVISNSVGCQGVSVA
jgi:hypothetical protein